MIDDNFNLAQGKKKVVEKDVNGQVLGTKRTKTNLWGVRLFDEGEVAAERRLKRGARRRIARRHERLNYLRGIFAEAIYKVDDSFFIRLDESFYQAGDKNRSKTQARNSKGDLIELAQGQNEFKYPLFKTEKEENAYYEQFPTIYHLRQHLMDQEVTDIRLVYLAMHHILKYRGHFVNQGQKFDLKNLDIAGSLDETLELFENATPFHFGIRNVEQLEANKILSNPKLSKSKKAFDLNELFAIDEEVLYSGHNQDTEAQLEGKTAKQISQFIEAKQKQVKALFTAIVGNTINLSTIFDNKQYSHKVNDGFPEKITYASDNFEATLAELERFLEPEEVAVIASGKQVYEAIILANIFNGKASLSAAMVAKFNDHKAQLKALKAFTKSISTELYAKFFKQDGIYTNFVETGKITRDDFYKNIKKAFEAQFVGLKFPETDKDFDFSTVDLTSEQQGFFEAIAAEMKVDNYLPKQRMSDNGAIPYQVHEAELVRIIDKQARLFPFLAEKSGEAYKIQTLMTFRIPYFVGPLTPATKGEAGHKTSDRSQFAWMQKLKDDKITPWNFDEVVDKEASAVEFIERMTGFCTYFPQEKVMAKNALTYQEFTVYNELIVSGFYEQEATGKRHKTYFNAEMMHELVEKLFKRKKKVTQDDVLAYLTNDKQVNAMELFGIDQRTINGKPSFNSSLSSYIDLTKAGISSQVIDDHRDNFDEIIKWQTIFTDKNDLKRKLKRANQDWQILTDSQIKNLSRKHYTGFGSLSKRLIF